MLEFFFSPTFFTSVQSMVDYILRICIYIFTTGVVVYFISLVFRLTTDREGKDNMYHLFLVGFSAIGLATYKIWAVWLGKIFVLLASAIFDLEQGNIMSEYLNAFFGDPNGGGLQMTMFNLLSLEMLSSLSYLLVMVVYEIFVVVQIIIQIFLYLLGPLAIVLSLFPTFYDIFKIWLANFCAVNFWSVLIAILFRLVETLTESSTFQQAVASGDKVALWNAFILGVIITLMIVLIPKLSLVIFKGGTSAADMGTYATGITAGVVVSTVWKRLKMASITSSQTIAARTGTGVVSGAQAMLQNPSAGATENAVKTITGGGNGNNSGSPFGGSTIENSDNGF